jgi:hypothetical protein
MYGFHSLKAAFKRYVISRLLLAQMIFDCLMQVISPRENPALPKSREVGVNLSVGLLAEVSGSVLEGARYITERSAIYTIIRT